MPPSNMPDKNTFARLKAAYSDLSEPEFVKMFADMYWHALIALCALGVIVSLVYGAMRFMGVQVTLSSNETQAQASTGKDIDRELLQNTVDGYQARAQKFTALASSTEALIDPAK